MDADAVAGGEANEDVAALVAVGEPGDTQPIIGSDAVAGALEPEIRKMWGMGEGSPFRDQYPEKFLLRVKDDGVMDNLGETRAKLEFDEARGIIHVALAFEGEKRAPEKKRVF